MSICVYCGQAAGDTKEHIIPQWLQKQFDLKDRPLGMMNGTTVQYSRAIVPACRECNSEAFSRLESKVCANKANHQDYYLWALKIRYCLSIIDSSYSNDRSNPSRGPILSKEFASIGYDFIKHAFTHLEEKRFYYRPYPFGSVFLRKNPIQDGEFGFVDVSHPFWALTIALPGNRLLSVLFNDRGFVKRSMRRDNKLTNVLKAIREGFDDDLATRHYAQLLTFGLLFCQYQVSNIPDRFSLRPDGIYSNKLPNKLKYRRKLEPHVLIEMSEFCGLTRELGQKVYDSFPANFGG